MYKKPRLSVIIQSIRMTNEGQAWAEARREKDLAEYAEQEWQAAMEKELNGRPALKVILAEQERDVVAPRNELVKESETGVGRKIVEEDLEKEKYEHEDDPDYTWEVLESNPPQYRRVLKSKYVFCAI